MLDITDRQYFQNLKRLWVYFRETGEIPPGVRPMIASSWMRSKDFHVNMTKPLRAPILSRPELHSLQAANQTLIDIAKPIMKKMHSLVGETKNLISLHNPDGYMLYSCGDEYYAEMETESSFSLGVCWQERYIGTNGITLAVLEDSPVQVYGAEHYCAAQHLSLIHIYGRSISYLAAYKLPKRNRVSRKENILVLDAAADGTLMEVQFLGDFLNRQRNGGWDLPQEVDVYKRQRYMGLVRASEKRRKAPGRARGLSYGNLNKTGKKQTRQQRRTDRTTRHSLRRKHKVHRPGRKKEVVCKKGLCHQKGSSTA